MNGEHRPACLCQLETHAQKRIVLTGGPGAGKTAVLELLRQHFCEHVEVLHEAASILFNGGFPRDRGDAIAVRSAQRAIFRVERELERMAEERAKSALVLCDRGTLDGLAYWPDAPETWFEDNRTSEAHELSRYALVIHLRVPAADQGYERANNPARIESAREAFLIDQHIERIWARHPRRVLVPATPEFLEKATAVLRAVRAEVPECCALR